MNKEPKFIEFSQDTPVIDWHGDATIAAKGSQWWITSLPVKSHLVLTEAWALWNYQPIKVIDIGNNWTCTLSTMKGMRKPWFTVNGITRAFRRLNKGV